MDRAIELIEQHGGRRIAMVGLSFKAGTDDLRESPFVSLAEYLLGKGYELGIYDPGISMMRLHGQNLAYVDKHLPHLAGLLSENLGQVLESAELVVIGTRVGDDQDALKTCKLPRVDLRKSLVVGENAAETQPQVAS